MRETTTTKIPDVRVEGAAQDGRVRIEAAETGSLRLHRQEHRPLGEHEPVARLSLQADGFEADIELTAGQLDALADAVHHAQAGLREEVSADD
jgi:hypothetical protein